MDVSRLDVIRMDRDPTENAFDNTHFDLNQDLTVRSPSLYMPVVTR